MEHSGAGGKLIDEKNQKQKISWHCPFNDGLRLSLMLLIYPELLHLQSFFQEGASWRTKRDIL